jgi:hypothetical protein
MMIENSSGLPHREVLREERRLPITLSPQHLRGGGVEWCMQEEEGFVPLGE